MNEQQGVDNFVFEYIFSLLGDQQDVCRVGAVCKLWRTIAHSQLVWQNIPIIINQFGRLQKFLQSVKDGLIPHVLSSRSLTLSFHYPRVANVTYVRTVMNLLKDQKNPVYAWYHHLTDITIRSTTKCLKMAHSTPCGMRTISLIDKHLLGLLSNCTQTKHIDIDLVSSDRVAKTIHQLCQEHDIKFETLHVHGDYDASQSFVDDMSSVIKRCAPSLLSIDLDYCTELLPVLSRHCATTLRQLSFDPTRDNHSTSTFSSLDELVIDDVFRPSEPPILDLATIGKSVRILTVRAYNVEREDYVYINHWLSAFTQVQDLQLCIMGDCNARSYTDATPTIELSGLEEMKQLRNVHITLDSGVDVVKINYVGILQHLAKTPVRQLIFQRCEALDVIARTVGTLFTGRLSLLHFIGKSTMTTESAKIACMALDKSAPNASFYATINEYNSQESLEIINCAIGSNCMDKHPQVKISAKAVNISVSW